MMNALVRRLIPNPLFETRAELLRIEDRSRTR